MSPEEKIEAAQKLIDEARAELAAKKRNWPETIEAGMVFYHNRGGFHYMACSTDGENVNNLVCLKAGQNYSFKNLFHGDEAEFTYLGHARDLIKIADDAHEPTGAELVGKICQVSLHPISEPNDGIRCLVTSFDPIIGYRTKEGEDMPWKYARLAR